MFAFAASTTGNNKFYKIYPQECERAFAILVYYSEYDGRDVLLIREMVTLNIISIRSSITLYVKIERNGEQLQ